MHLNEPQNKIYESTFPPNLPLAFSTSTPRWRVTQLLAFGNCPRFIVWWNKFVEEWFFEHQKIVGGTKGREKVPSKTRDFFVIILYLQAYFEAIFQQPPKKRQVFWKGLQVLMMPTSRIRRRHLRKRNQLVSFVCRIKAFLVGFLNAVYEMVGRIGRCFGHISRYNQFIKGRSWDPRQLWDKSNLIRTGGDGPIRPTCFTGLWY